MKLVLAILSGIVVSRAEIPPSFVLSCRADLVGHGHLMMPEIFSSEFTEELSSFSKARCQILLGDATLSARLSKSQPAESLPMDTTLTLELFRGDPIRNKLNRISVQGLGLGHWPVGHAQSFKGEEFMVMLIDQRAYSRVDYVCTLTRVR